MGSIPTHSRQSFPGGLAGRIGLAFLLGVWIAPADAQPAADPAAEIARPVPPETPPLTAVPRAPAGISGAFEAGPAPLERAFRSALFPAWGQLTNGRPKKAVVLFSVQTYIYTRIVLETRRAWEAQRRADRLTATGSDDPAILADIEAADASSQDHFGRRRDLLFWALVGGFYGAMDAYIDAQLGDFQGELERDRTLFGGVDPAEGTVELGLRF